MKKTLMVLLLFMSMTGATALANITSEYQEQYYYAILEKGTVAGKQLAGYRYLGVVPQSNDLIARSGYGLSDICEAYIDIISEYNYFTESDIFRSKYYYIYDIDKDGTPELIINDQPLPSASGIDVYTYKDNKAVFLGYMDGGRVNFYTYPGNGFAVSYTMDGYGSMDLISVIDGSLEVTQTWEVQKFNELALLPHESDKLTGFECSANNVTINYDYIKDAIVSQYRINNQCDDIKVLLNGSEIEFDQPPIIRDDRTLVPMRAIFEAMGCEVEWDDGTINVRKGNKDIMTLWIDRAEMWLPDGNIILDVPPQIVNDRTLVPVRAISESMGADVEWDGNSRTVKILRNNIYSDNPGVIETD